MKILQAREGVHIKFMYETLQIISYEVGTHERHWISKFAPMSVLVPSPKEQQHIADCLAALDEQIAAQSQKLDALRAHKKGLMQQLFPSADEVQG
jgi:type I restriction enzyme S subunit